MSKITFWNTLATQDVERARTFYAALGFGVRDMPGGAGITVHPSESSVVCLFPSHAFASMIPGKVCDAAQSQEIIQSISVDSMPAVDEVADKVKRAGGTLIGEPKELPFGYAFGFSDPDGHVWSVLWMPEAK